MKKVISTGKGGVGKTSTISVLACLMAREGRRVILFDTDPSMNLAMTLGIPYASVPKITEDKSQISDTIENSGIGHTGKQIIEGHSRLTDDGIRVVLMGDISHGGGGCLCSSISVVKLLLEYLDKNDDYYDIAIVDSQAGPEILGRGLASDFDCNMVITEPTLKSMEVSRQVMKLAKDLSVKNNMLIINKLERGNDVGKISSGIGISGDEVFSIRQDPHVKDADRDCRLLVDAYPECDFIDDVRVIKEHLEDILGW